jgi:hypothetical protein
LSNGNTTAVPQPIFGPQGFQVPPESAILDGVQSDIDAAFGGGLNPALSTPQGQIATSESAIIADSYNMFLWFCNQVDPALNSGRMQDAIARVYFITRLPAQPTVVQATCVGLGEVIIPVGALAKADDGNLYVCQEQGTIPSTGSIVLPFACAITGPIACPGSATIGGNGSLNTIQQAIPGWDSISNVQDGVLGTNVETRAALEERRRASTSIGSQGPLPAILAAVLQVPGVLDAYATENDTTLPAVIGGVIIGPNSLYIAVLGGQPQAVAQAIWSRKAPGCGYTGNTSQIVTDPSPQYIPPVPTYIVTWETPQIVDFAVLVVMVNNAGIPSNALTLIQNAIISGFAGTDGGSRAKIGSTVLASRYYGDVATLGAWAQIVDIQLGVSGTAAQFTGSIAGTTLTASAVSGAITSGLLLQDTTGNLAQGTTIVSQLTGPTGGAGTYVVSILQTVATEAMSGTALVNRITMNIDQAPAVSAGNIQLLLQ